MPSSAASCSSRIRLSVARASASSSSPRSGTPSTITSPAARSSAEILRITTAACSRGRRSGAAGTTVAATSATQPPMTRVAPADQRVGRRRDQRRDDDRLHGRLGDEQLAAGRSAAPTSSPARRPASAATSPSRSGWPAGRRAARPARRRSSPRRPGAAAGRTTYRGSRRQRPARRTASGGRAGRRRSARRRRRRPRTGRSATACAETRAIRARSEIRPRPQQPVDQDRLGLHGGRWCQTDAGRPTLVMAPPWQRARPSRWPAAWRPPTVTGVAVTRDHEQAEAAQRPGSGCGGCMGPSREVRLSAVPTLGRNGDEHGGCRAGCGEAPTQGRLWTARGGLGGRAPPELGLWHPSPRGRIAVHPLPTPRRSQWLTPIDPTSAGFLLAENRSMPMHVGGLQLFEKPEGAGRNYIREMFEAMRDVEEIAPLFLKHPLPLDPHRRPAGVEGGRPVRHRAPPPAQRAAQARSGPRAARARAGRLHSTRLAWERPLWETHVIEGLRDGRVAMYTKLHHALVDGVSAMRLLQSVLTTDPDKRDMPAPWGAGRRLAAATSPSRTTASPRCR